MLLRLTGEGEIFFLFDRGSEGVEGVSWKRTQVQREESPKGKERKGDRV